MGKMAFALVWVGLVLPGCGDDQGGRAAEAQQALAAVRPAYEKRRATIDAVRAQAGAWKGRSGVPALALGQRPKPQFALEPITAAPLPGTNGRILELDDAGGWDGTTGRLLWGDTTWLRDIDQPMRGQGHVTAGGVKRAFERFDAVRYLCVLVADTFRMPKVRAGSGVVFTFEFDPGLWQGKLLLFDLTTGELLGGRALSASSSPKVEFKIKGAGSRAEDEKTGQAAFEADLRTHLTASVDRSLEPSADVEAASAPAPGKTFEVWLIGVGTRKIEVIKQVRALTGLGLKDANDLVQSAPRRVQGPLARADAEAAQKLLEAAGATAEVR